MGPVGFPSGCRILHRTVRSHKIMTALPSSLPAARGVGSPDRAPLTAPARAAEGPSAFARTLAQVQASRSTTVTEVEVRTGDTLAGIVARHLRATQPQLSPSSAELLQLSAQVARDNGIANPHLIVAGQVIDLSTLESKATALLQKPVGSDLSPQTLGASASAVQAAALPAARPLSAASAFLIQHAQAAQRTASASGIPAQYMLAQAALESGWGQREIRHPDGRTSHNLFGIRASPNWRGATVDVWTTEYINGVSQRMVGRFRAYSSYEESFADYARLISQQPRYAQVMRSTADPAAFASALQQAGYATSPRYASALYATINTTAQLQSSVPQVRMAMAGIFQSQPRVMAAAEQAPLPAAQALNLRWTPIAPMPGSALAQASSALPPARLPS